MESSSDSDQVINANMVFMAQIEKVLSDSEASSSSADENIFEVSYYLSESESESEFETSEYYDNSTNFGLFVNNDDDQEIFHDAIESASENFIENHIDSQKDYDKSNVDHNDYEEKDHLVDKLIKKLNKKIVKLNTFEGKNNEFNEQIKVLNEKNDDLLDQTKVLKDQLQVKHVVIDTHVECHENNAKLEAERYKYMIRYSALFDNDKQHRKQIADQEVLFDKMSVELVELDKHVRDLRNTVLEKDFKISELEECTVHMIMPSKDNLYNGRKGIGFENPSYFEKAKDLRPTLYDEKVIGIEYTPMFLTHSNEALEIEKFKRSRENKIEFAYDYGNLNASFESSETAISESENQSENDCLAVENESDKEENSKVITPGMYKLRETSSAYVCNDAMNVSCNSRMCDLLDDNNFFIFDDESVKISPVSKIPFRKKPRDSMHIVQICLWIIDSGCSKHMMGNRTLLTNFVEKFLGTVRFGNNDFPVIAGYGDVVIGSMTIKKVYYIEGLGHNLFSVGQLCDKGLKVAF
nr:integrase, catalytic region, zinc finger, CCHC-type, peptidase aspartic, catalytic [Tanacetum cinerariifolium]